MVNKTKYYKLATGPLTTNVDEYIASWRAISDPICKALDVEVVGFDPSFMFRKGSPYSDASTHIEVPLWFAKILAAALSNTEERINESRSVLMAVQEQFRVHGEQFPDGFDSRLFNWVDDTVAGNPPNLRS